MASRFSFYSFPGYEFLRSTIVFSLVKCSAIQNQMLISRIDFLIVEIPISHIKNTIITSKDLYF